MNSADRVVRDVSVSRAKRHAAPALAGGALVLLIALSFVHIQLGPVELPVETIVEAIWAPDESVAHTIVRHLRLPRLAAAVLAGAALGLSGGLLQAVTRNPLASPGILGVTAGAHLALVLGLVLLPGLALPRLPVTFVGGLLAGLITFAIAGGAAASPIRLALAGVATSLALGAVASAVALLREETVAGVFLWGAGSLVQADWNLAAQAFPRVILGLGIALIAARSLDVYGLGDEVAQSLGQRVGLLRLAVALVAVFLASSAVCVAGPIGFVGLLAPNLLRLSGVRAHRSLLSLSALWGAVVLILADVGAQLSTGGFIELPAGVVAALFGAPALVVLIQRSARFERSLPHSAESLPAVWRLPARSLLGWGTMLLIGLFVVGLTSGAGSVASLAGLLEVLNASHGGGEAAFILDLRLPRLLVVAVAGSMLAVSGLLLQGVVRNPLASPELLGLTPAAGLSVLALLLFLPELSGAALQGAAFAGALSVLALLYGATRTGGLTPAQLALLGLAVSAFCAAASNLIVAEAGLQVSQALVWLAGTAYARDWGDLGLLLPWALLLLSAVWVVTRWLDLMALGDEHPRALGLPLEAARGLLLLLAAALAAAAVAAVGTVAFIGLVAPHVSRLLAGSDHRRLVPVTALSGSILMVLADTVGRLVLAPKEVPLGLVTAILGAPYFLGLLWRINRSR